MSETYIEGKTKVIFPLGNERIRCRVCSKDDITARDGKRHDVIPGKAALSNATTCHVFRFLKKHGIPLAFIEQRTDRSFIAEYCTMVPVEVVIRGFADGSYLARNPEVAKGTPLSPLVVEFYYKTKGKRAFDTDLPCDDPLMRFSAEHAGVLELHHPKYIVGTYGILRIGSPEVRKLAVPLAQATPIAIAVFQLLATAWRRQLGTLIDLKIEFGVTRHGTLVVADVIDADSWRVIRKNDQLSKEPYRQGASIAEVKRLYTMVADLTSRF